MIDLTRQFKIQDGSVVGRTHVGRGNVLTGRNNQDAFCWRAEPDCIVAVVSDGCGSAPYSEFGARLLANTVCRTASCEFNHLTSDLRYCYNTTWHTLATVTTINTSWRSKAAQVFIRDHLLATIVLMVITPETTTIASIGDGCFAVNGHFESLDIFDSRPPYLAYGLLDRIPEMPAESFQFSINAQLLTDQIESLMIGTDGVLDLQEAAEKFVPGKLETVGPIDQFWTDPRYFENPVAIDRKLHRLNSEIKRLNRGTNTIETFQGLLPDDTTMVVIKRQEH